METMMSSSSHILYCVCKYTLKMGCANSVHHKMGCVNSVQDKNGMC